MEVFVRSFSTVAVSDGLYVIIFLYVSLFMMRSLQHIYRLSRRTFL